MIIIANHADGFVALAPYLAIAIIAVGVIVGVFAVVEAWREYQIARDAGLIPRHLYARGSLRVQSTRLAKLFFLAAVAVSVAIDWPPDTVRVVLNTGLLLGVIVLITVDILLDRRMNRQVVTYLIRNRYHSFEAEDEA